MPQFFQAPLDPRTQNFIEYVNRLQWERKQRELAREEERDKQQGRTLMGGILVASVVGGAVVGGIAAGASAGAGAAATAGSGISTATTAGAAISAAEISAATAGAGTSIAAGMLSGAGTGLMYGAKYGIPAAQQLSRGDYAGAAGTAASAATNIMQASRDRKTYGYSLSKAERTDLRRLAMDAGMTLGQVEMSARELGMRPQEIIQAAQESKTDDARLQAVLQAKGVAMPIADAEQYEHGGIIGLLADVNRATAEQEVEQATDKAFAVSMARDEAGVAAAARDANMEYRPDPRKIAIHQAAMRDIEKGRQAGDYTTEQADRLAAKVEAIEYSWQPRIRPLTVEDEEMVSTNTGMIYNRDRDGRLRKIGKVAEDDIAQAILKYQVDMTKAGAMMGVTVSLDDAAAAYIKADNIKQQIEAGTYRQQAPPPPPPPPPGADATAPQAQAAPPGPQRQMQPWDTELRQQVAVQNATAMVAKAIAIAPDVEKWPAEMREQVLPAATLLNKMFLAKLDRGELLTPDEQELARVVFKIVLER